MCVPGLSSEDPEVAAVLARRPGPKALERARQLAEWLDEGGKERLDAELARERAETEAKMVARVQSHPDGRAWLAERTLPT